MKIIAILTVALATLAACAPVHKREPQGVDANVSDGGEAQEIIDFALGHGIDIGLDLGVDVAHLQPPVRKREPQGRDIDLDIAAGLDVDIGLDLGLDLGVDESH
ncbi:hypothetical protein IWQ57_004311 [Coemansia nantahalensis]|uniref:Uncharacterized protein n=1 Tax=Coemansia nantahalensis TaxID=2789366 RepID=A0ACC1JSQ6_9FUNG|nr:hypothetical protein IWQ57_004311 [Coemansia nantahalensis]